MKVTVLLSLGRHPKSGRLMLSPNDARALALAKKWIDQPRLVHVGEVSQQQVLRQYLGLGFDQVDLIELKPGQDVCSALAADLAANPSDLVLAGERACGQEDTGLVPYLLAQALGLPLIDRVIGTQGDQLTQFLPKGQRRVLTRPPACLLTVSDKAPLELEYLARRARQGRINIHGALEHPIPALYQGWQQEPSRPGRKRLSIASSTKGWDRFNKRMNTTGGAGVVHTGSVEQGAAKVLTLLREKKLL
ncbi:MAG: hypothetical protein ACPGU3_04155 [Litorivicinus sp.]